MFTFALSGKLPVTEDALTAALLDALRYSASAATVHSVLVAGVVPFRPGNSIPVFDGCDIQAWPPLGHREPDARLVLSLNGAPVCRLLIEAKLGAPKSGEGAIDDPDRYGDQLADYLFTEAKENRGTPVALLYLTHHAGPPHADMEASAQELGRLGRFDLASSLYWQSWRDVERRLSGLDHRAPWLEDLLRVLRRAKMRRFEGVEAAGPAPRAAGQAAFYQGRAGSYYPNAQTARPLGALTKHGWEYRRRVVASKS